MISGMIHLASVLVAVLAASAALGGGWARIFVRSRPRAMLLAPWFGIGQTGLILIALSSLGISVGRGFWIPIAAAAAAWVASLRFFPQTTEESAENTPGPRPLMLLVAGTFLAAFLLTLPAVNRDGTLSGFTIGNQDLFDYSLTAEVLKTRDFRPFIRPFGDQPENPEASMGERAASWQVPSTRWIPTFYLSFLSKILRLDSSTLFSILIGSAYALFIPLLWFIAKESFGLRGWGWAAFALALSNPHMIYVVHHGFLPQIAATGFLLGFYILLPDLAERGKFPLRSAAAAGFFAAAVLGSYLELFTFLSLTVAAYFVHLAVARELTPRECAGRLAAGGTICALLAPYQTAMLIPIVLFHSDWAGGGWEMSERYYLFLGQMGVCRQGAQTITPIPALEIAGGVAVAAGIGTALASSKRKALLIWIAFPFLLSGASSYWNNWNYRYFKNLTYIYFWAPLMLGALIARLAERKGDAAWARRAAIAAAVCVGLFTLAAGLNAAQRLKWAWLGARHVPQDRAGLGALNETPGVRTYYVQNDDPWESLWMGYRLRDKNLVFDVYHPYLRNEVRNPKVPWDGAVIAPERSASGSGVEVPPPNP